MRLKLAEEGFQVSKAIGLEDVHEDTRRERPKGCNLLAKGANVVGHTLDEDEPRLGSTQDAIAVLMLQQGGECDKRGARLPL